MEQIHTEIILTLMAEKIRQLQDEVFLLTMELKTLRMEKESLQRHEQET